MEKARLFLKGESISNLTEYNFANMVNDKIESGVPACILINIIKDTEQTASDLNDLVVSKLVGVRRVLQDIRATSPKVVVEVELSSNDYIRLMKAIGNGYSLTGYSSELKMRVSSLSKNDVTYLASNPAIKNREDNVIQEQNKERESKLKHTGYNNQGFVLSLEKCNLKIIVDKQALEPIINASKSDDTSLKFDVLITGKNKRARPLRIVLDSQHAYYQGVAIGTYNITGGYLNVYIDIVLDNNDNTHLLFTAIQMRCEVNPCNYNSRCISFDTINNRVLFKDLNGNMALFKSTKISIVSRQKDKSTKILKEWQKDASHELHATCSEDRKDANKETENEESASIHLVVDTTHYFHYDNNSTLESSLSSNMEYLRANIRINNMYIDKAKISGVYALKTSTYPGASILVGIKLTIGEYNKVMQYLNNSFVISGFLLNIKNRTKVVGSLRSLDFDGDTINLSIANMPLSNPTVKTIKIESEIKNAKQEQSIKQKEIYIVEMMPIATFTDIKVNDSDAKYKSILYPEVKFERLKDAKKYADAINKGIGNTLKSSNEISNLPMLTIDDFKDFRAYVEKATVGTSHHEGFKDNIAYSVVLCIYVPNEVIKKLKEDSISLEDIIGYALENIQICKKGKLKNITMATPGFPIRVYFNKINQCLKNNNSIWIQKDGDTVKTYRVLYTYVKNTKIKALVIEKE